MKSNFLPPPLVNNSLKRALMVCVVFLSAFHIAKADPNIEAAVIAIQNPDGLCDPAGATVTVGVTPTWVPTTYDGFYIASAKLYVLREKAPGVYREKLVATVGQQPNWQTTVDINGVHAVGMLKVEITYYLQDNEDPGNSGFWTMTSDFNDSPDYTLAVQSPVINSFTVANGQQVGPGSYELLGCLAGSYDLDFDIDHVYTGTSGPSATFEIFSVEGCSDPLVDNVYYLEYNEDDGEDYFFEDFLAESNERFRDLVENSTGSYRIRLRMDGGMCGGPDQEEIICVRIGEVPEFDKMYLIQNDEQASTPLDTVPAPSSELNSIFIGGFSGGLWAQLSSADYDYFRFRLEYKDGAAYQNVPLKSRYSSNNDTVGGTLNVQFNTMILNPGDFLFQNLGDYRVFLIVGVYGCTEDSTAGYFKINSTWQYKSAEATSGRADDPSGDIAIYPSPATDIMTVDYHNGPTKAFYTLSDFNGKVLLSGDLADGKSPLNISSLPTGAYLIHITSGNGDLIHRQKVMKL